MSVSVNETCDNYQDIFNKINYYFRDDQVINGTEFSPKEFGYFITFAYMVIILFGAIGNFLTITVVILNPAMRTTRNFFILNLALSDFFVCIVTAPTTLYTVLYMFWPFSRTLCKIAGSLQGFNIFLSTFSIASIAVDRYVLIIFPTKRERQQNLSFCFFIMIWITSLVLAVPLLQASDLTPVFIEPTCDLALYICHEQNEIWEKMIISKTTYTLSVLVTQYAFPLFSLVFAYSRIAHRMKLRFVNRNQSLNSNQVSNCNRRRSVVERQRRTHLLLVCVVAVFAVAWFPLNVFHIFNTFELVNSFSVTTFSACHCLAMCSACLNPLIYAFFNQNFRIEFMQLFDRVGLRSLRIILFGEQETLNIDLKTEYKSRTGCKTITSDPQSFLNANENVVLDILEENDKQL